MTLPARRHGNVSRGTDVPVGDSSVTIEKTGEWHPCISSGWYAKPAELPLPPSVGIHLMIQPDNDPEVVEKVIVTTEGAIVCVLPREYCTGPLDLLDEDWPSYRDRLTEGWVYLGDGFPHYQLGKPVAVGT